MSPPYQPVGNAPAPGAPGQVQPIGLVAGQKAPMHNVAAPSPFGVAEAFAGNPTPPYTNPETQYNTPLNVDKYMPGEEFTLPFEDQMAIPQLQASLIQAGLLSRSQVRPGQWDATSANAYRRVLAFANEFGITANQALNVFLNNPKLGGNGTQPTISFTNPQDVATGFQNVSQNLTGQEQPTAAFQQSYHAQEAAQAHQRGTNYTQAPSVTGAATQYLINNDPSQVQAYGAASRMLELQNMLGVK